MKIKEKAFSLVKKLQHSHGCLTEEDLRHLSSKEDIPLNELFSVASFYSFLGTRPKGKYVIRLCKSLPCYIKGSREILKALQDKLKIVPGETTEDKRFSLELVNCIGACDIAPAMLINDRLYGNLTKEKIDKIIDECN